LTLLLAPWGSHVLCGSSPSQAWTHAVAAVRLDHGSNLLAGEFASLWCCLLLGSGMSSTGMHLLPSMVSMVSSNMEDGFWPQHSFPLGNRHRGLHGRSVLHPWCGHGESERCPRAVLSRDGRPKLSSPPDVVRNSSAESSIMACCGVDASLRVEPMMTAPSSPLLGERLRPSK
jgi:hypothetical protein